MQKIIPSLVFLILCHIALHNAAIGFCFFKLFLPHIIFHIMLFQPQPGTSVTMSAGQGKIFNLLCQLLRTLHIPLFQIKVNNGISLTGFAVTVVVPGQFFKFMKCFFGNLPANVLIKKVFIIVIRPQIIPVSQAAPFKILIKFQTILHRNLIKVLTLFQHPFIDPKYMVHTVCIAPLIHRGRSVRVPVNDGKHLRENHHHIHAISVKRRLSA